MTARLSAAQRKALEDAAGEPDARVFGWWTLLNEPDRQRLLRCGLVRTYQKHYKRITPAGRAALAADPATHETTTDPRKMV